MADYDSVARHLTFVETDGRARLPEIPGSYGGYAQVAISSSIEPRLWLTVSSPVDANKPDGEQIRARLHVDLKDAVTLTQQLQYVAEHEGVANSD